ncbi:MAG: hypothetical protein GY729_05540 [Desulfobacteraceae bacterium]|nr:hypothetical protein [Desulfobacteraceae bacterium]
MNKKVILLKAILMVLTIVFFHTSGFAQKLTIHVGKDAQALLVKAEFGTKTKTFTIPKEKEAVDKFELVYSMFQYQQKSVQGLAISKMQFLQQISNKEAAPTVSQTGKDDDVHKLLRHLGRELYGPIEAMVEKASQIEFVISTDCIRFPFDGLYFKDRQLFLQKPVLYNLNGRHDSIIHVNEDWKGFMVSERTADPDRGVLLAKNMFPGSTYFDSSQVRALDFRKAGNPDFILISTHGGTRAMWLDHMTVYPRHLTSMKSELVYLDSCTLGISHKFIAGLQKAGTKYYLGPILSNEDGNSSTITMDEFFKALLRGEEPAKALFSARKILYKHFTDQKNDFSMLMYRAFTFRVYRLN